MTAAEFRTAVLRAFVDRDRPALETALRAFTDPQYGALTPERLRQHRAEAAERLNHIDAAMQRQEQP